MRAIMFQSFHSLPPRKNTKIRVFSHPWGFTPDQILCHLTSSPTIMFTPYYSLHLASYCPLYVIWCLSSNHRDLCSSNRCATVCAIMCACSGCARKTTRAFGMWRWFIRLPYIRRPSSSVMSSNHPAVCTHTLNKPVLGREECVEKHWSQPPSTFRPSPLCVIAI